MYKEIWQKQEGLCYYCGRRILRDQERSVISVSAFSSALEREKYIHTKCKYTHVEIIDEGEGDLFKKLSDEMDIKPWKFYPLYEFFLKAEESIIELSFKEIEKILHLKNRKISRSRSFWQRTGLDNISRCFLENGYTLAEFQNAKGKLVFRREMRKRRALEIPDAITRGKLTPGAKHEIERFFQYVVKKYSL